MAALTHGQGVEEDEWLRRREGVEGFEARAAEEEEDDGWDAEEAGC